LFVISDFCLSFRSVAEESASALLPEGSIMTRSGKLKLALIFAAVLAASAIRAQNSANLASAAALTFDVASIRENNTSTDDRHHIYNDPSVSHFRTVNLSVKDLIQFAYGLPESQILGGPPWLDTIMFDIDAKSDPSVDAQLHALPTEQARHQKQLMVQALLADRFHLSTHQETRQLPVFALVIAKDGPKFKPSDVNGTTIDTGRSRLHIAGSDDTLAILSRELAQSLGRVVLNQTGMTGRYDITLKWTPDDASGSSPASDAPPDIFTAIQEQLGLKLVSTKGPVPVLVIDHIERPTPN
jgi:uncharacterized protein (TIGR03435 family)